MRVTRIGLTLLLVALCAPAFAGEEHISPSVVPGSRVAPEYPPAALAAKYDATVTVLAEIRADGSVAGVEVIESTRPNLGFEASAMAAVANWEFNPATMDGEGVDAFALYRLNFQPRVHRGPGGGAYVMSDLMASSLRGVGGVDRERGELPADMDIGLTRMDGPPSHVRFVRLPPCRGTGCMYDRSKLVPRGDRNRGGEIRH